jgi:hypothetical protein
MIDALGDILRPAEDRFIVLAGFAAVLLVTAAVQLATLAIVAAIVAFAIAGITSGPSGLIAVN